MSILLKSIYAIHNTAFGGDTIKTCGKRVQPFLFFIILVCIQFYILFGNGMTGLSDNGDFIRVMRPNYIVNRETGPENRFTFIKNYYLEPKGSTKAEKALNLLLTLEEPMSYPSLQHLFIKFGILVNLLFNSITRRDILTFNIGALGLLHITAYAASLALLMDNLRGKDLYRDIIMKIIAVVMFCDVGYVAYFNSFYGEAPQLVFFILAAGLGLKLLRNGGSLGSIILFYVALIAFAWTKFANIPTAAFTITATAIAVFLINMNPSHRRSVIAAAGISFIALAGIWIAVPRWMELHTNYNAVFFGILREDRAAGTTIRELELPEYMKELQGTTYYDSGVSSITSTDGFAKDFSKLSKTDIALYYLKNPGLLAEKLRVTAKHSGFIRPPYLSNRDKSYSRLYFDNSFSLWEHIRKELPFDTIWFNSMICLLFLVLTTQKAFLKYGKHRNKAGTGMIIALAISLLGTALINFCLPVISNGEADIAKHMFAFVSCIDLMIVVSICLLINSIPTKACLRKKLPSVAVKAAFLIIGIFVIDFSYQGILKPLGISTWKEGEIKELNYIELGEYRGKKLLWQVIKADSESCLLICSSVIDMQSFSKSEVNDGYGSNLWKDSSLRNWLNTEFYNAFNSQEKKLILDCKNKYLLSLKNLHLKKGGERDFYWTHIPELVDRGYEKAYFDISTDRVFLPDVSDISYAFRIGADIRRNRPYWLETPYFYNPSMVRVVFRDGYIYMKDASLEDIGVVPAIRIGRGNFRGSGSADDPYRLDS